MNRRSVTYILDLKEGKFTMIHRMFMEERRKDLETHEKNSILSFRELWGLPLRREEDLPLPSDLKPREGDSA